jgi:Family of unknown function (DUF6421)/Domain of unknown function (DUF4350)
MLSTLQQRKVAGVLFDEFHGEAWSIRPEVAKAMRPEHPQASSYAAAAQALADRDFTVAANSQAPLVHATLDTTDVLVLAHPSEPRWERTVNENSPLLTSAEIAAIDAFVAKGGGLVVLGETEEDKYGNNLNDLLKLFGLRIENGTVFDYVHSCGTPGWVRGYSDSERRARSLLHLVDEVCFYRAGVVAAEQPDAIVLHTGESAQPPLAGMVAAVQHGEGRVVVTADSDLFGDDHLAEGSHRQLWLNLLYWVSAAAFESAPEPAVSQATDDPAWLRLKRETNALRALQGPKGEVDLGQHDPAAVRAHVEAMIESIAALAPRFPHQQAYLARLPEDLRAWVHGGCGKPDFMESLALFRPEQNRDDGVQHLVVFPMYTPNASSETGYEAMIVRTPWPAFIDRLERHGFDNQKYVPVQLVDYTDGYDSECAVLFPETVSLSARPTNYFGGIFCDREASRFQRAVQRGSQVLGIELPPDAAALVSNGDLVRDTYILWDMIHDRWHSHGDLPFDPFMIRQRLPYWMYSLEELRVDLATYGTAGELARDGFAFARYVQYAILFDRILRFPITGNRVRNYDGLGGQLLFAYLHARGSVKWSDNHLLIDWRRIEEGVAELRERIEELYRHGIDTSKVSYWIAAHELVATYVTPNVSSQWHKPNRVYSDEADPRAWIQRVNDDEFPLSLFYEQYKKKLADAELAAAA